MYARLLRCECSRAARAATTKAAAGIAATKTDARRSDAQPPSVGLRGPKPEAAGNPKRKPARCQSQVLVFSKTSGAGRVFQAPPAMKSYRGDARALTRSRKRLRRASSSFLMPTRSSTSFFPHLRLVSHTLITWNLLFLESFCLPEVVCLGRVGCPRRRSLTWPANS